MFLSPSTSRGAPVSQADALRNGARAAAHGNHAHGPATLLCASGRGGSGTTLVAALLAVAAAGDGHRVLLVDADDLVGPAAMLLGVRPRTTWQQLRSSNVAAADVVTPVTETLSLVAGGIAAGNDAAPISAAERRACMRRLSPVAERVDLVVVDCGARLDALASAITPHVAERLVAVTAGSDPVSLASTYAVCKAARMRHDALPLDVVVNRQSGADALRCFDAVDAGARQFLGTALGFAGAVPLDHQLDAALRGGMSFWDAAIGSPAALAAHDIVTRVLDTALPSLSSSRT